MRKRKIFFTFSFFVSIVITIINVFFENEIFTNIAAPIFWPNNVSCYFMKSRGILELGLGQWDDVTLIPDRCIFFLETSCFDTRGTSDIWLNEKTACAVESAAKTNPSFNIFLLYLTGKNLGGNSTVLEEKLTSYENVYIRRVKLSSHFEDTPLGDWFSTNTKSIFNCEDHEKIIFELVRITTLWKYGGIFGDLDFNLKRPLEEFSNFVVHRNEMDHESTLLGIGISTELGRNVLDFAFTEITARQPAQFNTMQILGKFCDVHIEENKKCHFAFHSSIDDFLHSENNTEFCPKMYTQD